MENYVFTKEHDFIFIPFPEWCSPAAVDGGSGLVFTRTVDIPSVCGGRVEQGDTVER